MNREDGSVFAPRGECISNSVIFAGYEIKTVGSNVRGTRFFDPECTLGTNQTLLEGDVLLASVSQVGSIDSMEDLEGHENKLSVGDVVVVVMGNRYSGTSENGYVPNEGVPTDGVTQLDLLAHGGIAGIMREIPDYKIQQPTKLSPIGAVTQPSGKKLNIIKQVSSSPNKLSDLDVPIIAVMGSGAEIGKTTTAAKITRLLSDHRFRVAVTKLSGTGRLRDLQLLESCGAVSAFDFVDFGLPSTYTSPENYKIAITELLGKLSLGRVDVIVAEFGGDIVEANVPTFLEDPELSDRISDVFYVADDILGVILAEATLKEKLGDAVHINFVASWKRNKFSFAERIQQTPTQSPVINLDSISGKADVLRSTSELIIDNKSDISEKLSKIIYENDNQAFKLAEKELVENGFVIIRGFPIEKGALMKMMAQFGLPIPKLSSGRRNSELDDFIGDVSLMPENDPNHKLPTQNSEALRLHTAHSYRNERPEIFAMLMSKEGWVDNRFGFNGESLIVKWRDVMQSYVEKYGDLGISDLELLTSTPISYSPFYVTDNISSDPLLGRDAKGNLNVRYWGDMESTVNDDGLAKISGDKKLFQAAIHRFDAYIHMYALGNIFRLRQGDLIIIDNQAIGHGRLPIVEERWDNGQNSYNPRKIYSMHIKKS